MTCQEAPLLGPGDGPVKAQMLEDYLINSTFQDFADDGDD